jgi:hypothetical protein
VSSDNVTVSSYLSVANAIALRVSLAELSLSRVVEGRSEKLNLVDCETATLQIRLLCELYMLGCQLAHLEDGNAQISENKWRPVDAFGEIRDLSDHPLPIPVLINLNGGIDGAHQVDPVSKPIRFSDISRIYGQCGDLLHIPTIKQIKKDSSPLFDVRVLMRWMLAFKKLSMAHTLVLPERQIILLSTWSGAIDDVAEVYKLVAEGPSTLDLASLPDCDFFS